MGSTSGTCRFITIYVAMVIVVDINEIRTETKICKVKCGQIITSLHRVRKLFVILFFLFSTLNCLSFFDVRLLIINLFGTFKHLMYQLTASLRGLRYPDTVSLK
jgi:predicted nucleic acid-binding Zn ribbon protein